MYWVCISFCLQCIDQVEGTTQNAYTVKYICITVLQDQCNMLQDYWEMLKDHWEMLQDQYNYRVAVANIHSTLPCIFVKHNNLQLGYHCSITVTSQHPFNCIRTSIRT